MMPGTSHGLFTKSRIFIFILLIVFACLPSCIPQKKVLLMQYNKLIDSTYAKTFEGKQFEDTIYRISPNDYLYISVTTVEKPITQFMEPSAGVNFLSGENQAQVGYHVNDDGTIYFPYIGVIPLGGLTIGQARDTMRLKVAKIVGRCRIDVILINNTVCMLGEFTRQGTFNMTRSKLSIYETIALAGGLTDYAKRDKIKVLRTERGEKKMYVIDLRSGNLIGKNMFYVYPNDLIYAEPMKAKSIGITPTFSLSLLSSLVTVAVIIRTLFN